MPAGAGLLLAAIGVLYVSDLVPALALITASALFGVIAVTSAIYIMASELHDTHDI